MQCVNYKKDFQSKQFNYQTATCMPDAKMLMIGGMSLHVTISVFIHEMGSLVITCLFLLNRYFPSPPENAGKSLSISASSNYSSVRVTLKVLPDGVADKQETS